MPSFAPNSVKVILRSVLRWRSLAPIRAFSSSSLRIRTAMDHTIEFWLPFPPSTNRLWRSVRGRVILSRHYKDWKKSASDAIIVLQNLGKSPVLGTHELSLKLKSNRIKIGDADNRIKAVLDIAAECHLIVNDKQCRRSSVEWATIEHECLVRLTGEIAYADQWEFASALAARKTVRRKARLPRQAFGLPLRKLPRQAQQRIVRQLSLKNDQ